MYLEDIDMYFYLSTFQRLIESREHAERED